MNTTIDEYLTLGPAHRDRVRVAVRDLAVRANERYAGLLAAEAVLAARTTYPDTHRLVFRLGTTSPAPPRRSWPPTTGPVRCCGTPTTMGNGRMNRR